MSKTKVGIIFGGASSEHEISLMSASSVLRNIPRDKYDVLMIGITRDGEWFEYKGDIDNIQNNTWNKGDIKRAFISPDTSIHGLTVLEEGRYNNIRLDVVFPVLHGKNGEDGTIQGLFEMAGIPCVGCNYISSANCMDKVFAHMILDANKIKTAKYVVGKKSENFDIIIGKVEAEIGYPCFVKPANAGSSVGVGKAEDIEQLKIRLINGFEHDKKVVIEKAIVGQEIEFAVMGNENPVSSEAGEIAPTSEFYDYEAKYVNGTTELYIPARIPEDIAEEMKKTAIKAYKAMECSGFTRVDFFLTKDNEVILNELNTIPGFTNISMYPKLWDYSGVEYGQLIDKLIQFSLEV